MNLRKHLILFIASISVLGGCNSQTINNTEKLADENPIQTTEPLVSEDEEDKQITEIPFPYNNFNYFFTIWKKTNSSTTRTLYMNEEKIFESNNDYHLIPLNGGKYFYKRSGCNLDEKNEAVYTSTDNFTCLVHNDKEYSAIDWPNYVDEKYIVYQECKKIKFYNRIGIPGMNDCEILDLKLNDQIIDTSKEYYDEKEQRLLGAALFSSININGDFLTYIRQNEITKKPLFVIYNLKTKQKRTIDEMNGKPISYGELVNDEPAFILWNEDYSKDFYYRGKIIQNISAFTYINNSFYFVKPDPITDIISEGITILRDDIGISHFDGDFFYTLDSIGVYPNCNIHFLICFFDQDNYMVRSGVFDSKFATHINGKPMPEDLPYIDEDDLFAFSENGNTYIVYAFGSEIIGKNLNTNEETTLYQFGGQTVDLKVFRK